MTNASSTFSAPAAPDKYYVVPMFPHPSGKLHMGHARNYAIADAYARHARARGMSVMFPMGWDSFGLPAEKAAISMGADPRAWTEANIAQMRDQLGRMDLSFDRERDLSTHEPSFYRHTQAVFVALMRAGLVYKKEAEVWWDPVDRTVLANEQVVDGLGWRSGAAAERKSMSMYWIATTAYAKEMACETLTWSAGAKADHQEWLGPEAARGEPRLRDWCVSRQRRWGTPVPAIECAACGPSPMPEADLPHAHERMGEPCACPACGGPAIKSNETLDTFFDSSWYFLRYPEQGEAPCEQRPVGSRSRAWAPVDLYVGGREHATMHLVYARFMSRAMADCGFDVPREPFVRYMAQGMVKARAFQTAAQSGAVAEWVDAGEVVRAPGVGWSDAQGRPVVDMGVKKMSKSARNGVDPGEVVAKWGVDATRLFLFFAAPFEFDMEWDERGLAGCARFVNRFRALGAALEAGQPASRPGDAREDVLMDEQRREIRRFCDAEFESHEGLNALVAAIMAQTTRIHRATQAGTAARRAAYLDVCRALHPLAPTLAASCAALADPSWNPAWGEYPAGHSVAESAMVDVALQWEGRFVEAASMPRGLGKREAYNRAVASSARFRDKALAAKAGWEKAVWVENRALNGRGPKAR